MVETNSVFRRSTRRSSVRSRKAYTVPPGNGLCHRAADDLGLREGRDHLGGRIPDLDDPGVVDEHHAVGDERQGTRGLRALLGATEEERVVDRRGGAPAQML